MTSVDSNVNIKTVPNASKKNFSHHKTTISVTYPSKFKDKSSSGAEQESEYRKNQKLKRSLSLERNRDNSNNHSDHGSVSKEPNKNNKNDDESSGFLHNLFRKTVNNNEPQIDMISYRKKFYLLYLTILQLFSEISLDCKERSILLHKCFKAYFSEVEKKNQMIIQNLKQKIIFYKNLIKTIMFQKDRKLESIETMTDVLKSQRLTEGSFIKIL